MLKWAQFKKEKMKSALWKLNKWIKGRNLLKAVYEIQIFTQDPASDSTKWMQMCLSSTDVQHQHLQHQGSIDWASPTNCQPRQCCCVGFFFPLVLGQRVDLFQRLLYL